MKKIGDLVIVRGEALKVDGWTYGDWRQYVAFLDNDEAVCVRHSDLTLFLAMIGLVLLALAGFCVWVWASMDMPLLWGRLAALTLIGFVLIGPERVRWLTPWRLVVVVGLTKKKEGDGWYRLLGDET